ncbi:MAG: ABC transporter permease [Candidatus Nanopelagicales bacterium]
MKPKLQNSSYQSRDKDRIFIPMSTFRSLLGDRYVNNLVYRARTPEVTKVAERHVYETLGRKYQFDPDDKDALNFWDTSEWETRFGYMFLAFNVFFAIVGSFTLLVGGIGITNIMLVSVTERTREIGIRKAIGASRRFILLQFLLEATVLSVFGATAGLLIALLVSRIEVAGSSPSVVPISVVGAYVISVAIGLFFGSYPAKRAASLRPIEALRHE